MDDRIDLEVLSPDLTEIICAQNCGSKCCNFRLSEHYVPVEIVDYGNLSRLDLEKFVSFYHSVELPQLLSKPSGNCIFLNESSKKCMIYEFRPAACRKYPYREEEDENEDVPDWCELLYRSGDSLKQQRLEISQKINDTVYEMRDKIDYDVLMEYLQLENSTQVFQLPDFTILEEQQTDTSFWRMECHETKNFTTLLNIIKEYEETYFSDSGGHLEAQHPLYPHDFFETNWILISTLVYNDDLEIIATLVGILRRDVNINVPYLGSFPPDYIAYDRLMRIISSTKDLEKHMIRGAIVPDNFEDVLKARIASAVPINLENQ